ncbi:hypothetical protein H1S01_04500 [Heliobacterium chlorum]|uniref:Uncharacterized protein n=1 Tax=Heliobacterium chlorum TaxID=2698 RepID=A0ABR7T0X4_HELCL|nr:hypothetical protein [Heliobacterium chlorum]MBC9783772.1 hypothetical protein [Heliobacterium chlorum]
MSFPTIPNINPNISVEEAVSLILSCMAFEELGLAHIINAEAEKIQFVLDPLHRQDKNEPLKIKDLIEINSSVERTIKAVINQQMLILFKLEEILRFLAKY